MIVGGPFCFALQFDVVENWNLPGDIWKNGIFSLYLSGERVFSIVDVCELKTILGFCSKIPVSDLEVNDEQLDGVEIYKSATEYFWGDGIEVEKGLCDLTTTVMSDNGFSIFY